MTNFTTYVSANPSLFPAIGGPYSKIELRYDSEPIEKGWAPLHDRIGGKVGCVKIKSYIGTHRRVVQIEETEDELEEA